MADSQLAVSIPEAAKLLGISRHAAYRAVQRGDIPSKRIGRRVIVPLDALQAWLQGEPAPTVTDVDLAARPLRVIRHG